MPSPPPVFILTTGRTGSTMLSEMLKSHPSALSLSEVLSSLTSRALTEGTLDGPAFFSHMTTQGPVLRAMYRSGIRQGEILYEQGRHGELPLTDIPPLALVTLPFLSETPLKLIEEVKPHLLKRGEDKFENHLRFLFDWLSDRFGKTFWVERSGDSLLYAERLADMFPDARFIHLHRDGRDVALSMSKHSDFRAKVSYYRTLGMFGVNPYRTRSTYGIAPFHAWIEAALVSILPIGMLTDAKVDANVCAQYWDRTTRAGLRMLDALDPERVCHVSYERLVRDPIAELGRLMEFMNADTPDEWLASAATIADVRAEKWRALPSDELKRLEAACGESLVRLRYK